MEQRNLLIAIALSIGIMIAFQFVFERLHPPPPPTTKPPASEPAATGTAPSTAAPAVQSAPPAGAGAAAHAVEPRDKAIAENPHVKIETPRLHGSIDLVGARLNDLTLATYHETVDPKSPEVALLSPSGTQEPYLAEFGWVAANPVSYTHLTLPTICSV